MFVGPKRPMPTRPMRNNKINEAVAANVSVGSDAFNAPWVDMADANGSNDGKFDSSSSVSFPLLALSRSPSHSVAKPLLK